MENKKNIIYTEGAKVKLDLLFHDLQQDIEEYYIKNKYTLGEELIEITTSDIENIKRKITIRQNNKSDIVRLTLLVYFFAGILLTFVGLNYQSISDVFHGKEENKFEIMLTLTGAILSFFSIFFYFTKYQNTFNGKKEIETNSGDTLIDRNRERFIELINHQNKELQVKRRKNILVLSNSKDEESFLRDFFIKMDFQFVEFRHINENINTDNFDLVLFNNENGTIELTKIYEYSKAATEDKMFFYFGAKRLEVSEIEPIINRLAISNLRPQLYGSIIQALIFQETLK